MKVHKIKRTSRFRLDYGFSHYINFDFGSSPTWSILKGEQPAASSINHYIAAIRQYTQTDPAYVYSSPGYSRYAKNEQSKFNFGKHHVVWGEGCATTSSQKHQTIPFKRKRDVRRIYFGSLNSELTADDVEEFLVIIKLQLDL